MAVFWVQTRQENAELRKRLEGDASTENVCKEAQDLKQKQAVMQAQVANILASPAQFQVSDYDMDTYPKFGKQFMDDYIQRTQLKLYLVYGTIPAFVFDDAESECQDCEYRKPQQLANGDIYIGQWKNEQKFGRGTEIFVDGTVRQGYYEDGMFVGKRREITVNGSTKEWTEDGAYTLTDFSCSRRNRTCRAIPKEEPVEESTTPRDSE